MRTHDQKVAASTKALQFIQNQISSQGYPPTVREVGNHIGIESTSTVYSILRLLQTNGQITVTPNKARAISVHS